MIWHCSIRGLVKVTLVLLVYLPYESRSHQLHLSVPVLLILTVYMKYTSTCIVGMEARRDVQYSYVHFRIPYGKLHTNQLMWWLKIWFRGSLKKSKAKLAKNRMHAFTLITLFLHIWFYLSLSSLHLPILGINVIDTFDAIKMLDKVTLEMKQLGEGAIPYDGGLYPVRFRFRFRFRLNIWLRKIKLFIPFHILLFSNFIFFC